MSPRGGDVFLTDSPSTLIYTLSLHDALPISVERDDADQTVHDVAQPEEPPERGGRSIGANAGHRPGRSEEHTSELQSLTNLVCRLLLEKKNDEAFFRRLAGLDGLSRRQQLTR